MLLPIQWLEKYIEVDVSDKELSDKLTSSGSNVESIIKRSNQIKNVVVGRIENIEPHNNADKLVVCQVDIGEEVLQIVTGAKNMIVNDYVAVAKVGAVLPGEFKIKKSKLRGIDSYGMLCSLEELGYDVNLLPNTQKEGILILDKAYELGKDINKVLNLDKSVLEIEVTPNRPDCLSIIGLARETKAVLRKELNLPKINIEKEVSNINNYVENIKIENNKCNRYYGRVVRNIKVEDSPLWLQLSLMNAGVRPVNNIVDITNYVMLETGQPLHAFDYDKINGKNIIVRNAKENEDITTLDNENRKLSNEDIVISDEKQVLAIAGVMGGIDSEVDNNTKTIFIEGANFDKSSIRATSRKFNLRSDSSFRFERGIDPKLAQKAVDRACELIESLSAGEVVKGSVDKKIHMREERQVPLRYDRVNRVLGTNISKEEIIKYLELLNFELQTFDDKVVALIPTYRTDINIEADLIEEVGRLYGFNNIEGKPLITRVSKGNIPYSRKIIKKAQNILLSYGYNEVMTYSFIGPNNLDKLNINEKSKLRKYVELKNPLGKEYSIMRTSLTPAMMELLSRNYNRGIKNMYAFEIGNIFIPKEVPVINKPMEKKSLSIGFYGKDDFYFLKDTINELLNRLGIEEFRYEVESNNPTFHPGRTANLIINNKKLGILGEVHMDVLKNYNFKDRVYVAELDLENIIKLVNLETKYQALPKYPSISRDIAIVVDEDVLVGDIEDIIKYNGKNLVENIELFDIYTGDQIEDNKKSLAFTITYRSYDRTLKDKEVNKIQNSIIADIKDRLNGNLRE